MKESALNRSTDRASGTEATLTTQPGRQGAPDVNIYLGLGEEDPAVDRAVIQRGGLKTTIVAVPTREAAVDVAVQLVDAGAQSIELCGGFGSAVTTRVIEAVGDRVPVGAVSYSMESVHPLASLFAPAAA